MMTHGSRFKVTSAKVALVLMCVLTCDAPDGERDLVLYPQRSEIFDYIYILYTNKMKDNIQYTNKTQEKSKSMIHINKEHDSKCKER